MRTLITKKHACEKERGTTESAINLGPGPMTAAGAVIGCRRATRSRVTRLLTTQFIKEDSPFFLFHAISRTLIGPCKPQVSVDHPKSDLTT